MRNVLYVLFAVLFVGCASSPETVYVKPRAELKATPSETTGRLQVEIHSPSEGELLTDGQSWVEVEGGASTFGGVRHFDLILLMDTSTSLERTDPDDYRSQGAIGLVQSLSPRSDIQIGVVSFDSNGELVLPLTRDRGAVVEALSGLGRFGQTDLAAGIRTALEELRRHARPDSSRVIMLFTDGKSNATKARRATAEARQQGVAVQTLLLGSSEKGAEILHEIAQGTGASFVHVTNPARLPEAFLNLRTTGIDYVTLRVNDSEPYRAHLAGGTFTGRVELEPGENHIVAAATSVNGQTRESAVDVRVGPPACAPLELVAMSDGRPAVSISDRAVAIVVDASRSMWGRMDGEPKMVVAKDILHDVAAWVPQDLQLALRAYGNTSPSEAHDCSDSSLLVGFGKENRGSIRRAIARLRPTGQTPIAFALNQVANDFGTLRSERAVVLVTDGIESCGGNPVEAARALADQQIVTHVIGFGLGNGADEDSESLRAIAQASGGRFLTAASAMELKDALAGTVGTAFRIYRGETLVATGALGAREPILLPPGNYRVRLDSSPPYDAEISLADKEGLTLMVERDHGVVSHTEQRRLVGYVPCTGTPETVVEGLPSPDHRADSGASGPRPQSSMTEPGAGMARPAASMPRPAAAIPHPSTIEPQPTAGSFFD
jgi:Mg-chelatase subunit ChlD